jgi:two-component system heavy metal sensor histidine kinase CusS
VTCSLRTRLSVGTAVGMAVALLAGGVLLYLFQRNALLAQMDRSLLEQARLFASTVEIEFGELATDFGELDMRDFADADGPRFLQLWEPDGTAAFRSPSLADGDLPLIATGPQAPAWGWVRLLDGARGRAVWLAFAPSGSPLGEDGEPLPVGGDWTRLVVAGSTVDLDAGLARFRSLLLIVGALTLVFSLAALYCVVRRGLRPLGEVAAGIRRLDGSDLSARVTEQGVPAEVRPVTERLNEFLGRLEAAFARERAFSAEVAHELRTPLAGIRLAAEVALARERTKDECREALQDILGVAEGMEGMVVKLLEIARLEEDRTPRLPEQVSVNDLLRACWEQFSDVAGKRGLKIDWALGPEVSVATDRRLLELAVRNLLENAVVHSDDGGSARLETAANRDRIEIRVANSGSLLSQGDAAQAFERFWRGDSARTEAGVRCGLGLPLVRRIADVLGAEVSVRSQEGGEFRVTLSMPAGAERGPS